MHTQLHSNNSYKAKILEGVVCTGACLCLGTKLDFLRFMNVDPHAPTWLFLIDIVTRT
jgi:hypothetical protein